MNKLMHAKEQDRRRLDAVIEGWFNRHFGHIPKDDPIYPLLIAARDDAKNMFGIRTLAKENYNGSQ